MKKAFFLFFFMILTPAVSYCVVDDGSILHSGEATFYGDGGMGNCGFPGENQPVYHGAMNKIDYDSAAVCGAWVHIVGPKGEVIAFIDDQCPECLEGDIDLGPGTFEKIADRELGRVPITWRYVEAPVSGPIEYHWQSGSSRWHIGVQIRNHLHAISKVEIKIATSEWVQLNRGLDNYFILEGGIDNGSPGPFVLRVTDIFGGQLIDSNMTIQEGESVQGSSNFSPVTNKNIFAVKMLRETPVRRSQFVFMSGISNTVLLNGSGLFDLFTISGRRLCALKTLPEINGFLQSASIKGMLIIRQIQ